ISISFLEHSFPKLYLSEINSYISFSTNGIVQPNSSKYFLLSSINLFKASVVGAIINSCAEQDSFTLFIDDNKSSKIRFDEFRTANTLSLYSVKIISSC